MNRRLSTAASALLFVLLFAPLATAQDASQLFALAMASQATPAAAGQTPPATGPAVVGVIRSATRNTLVIRAQDGHYELFLMDSNTTRPAQLPVGATVSVTSRTTAVDQPPSAVTVRVTAPPPPAPPAGQQPNPNAPATAAEEPVPQSVRQLESQIKRQTKAWHIGARAGLAIDPELVMFGAQGKIGPFFDSNVSVVPSLELGFGEVTTLVALNLDVQYRLPVTEQSQKWGVFIGLGPAFNFSKRSFSDEGVTVENPEGGSTESSDRFSFSDLSYDTGFNVVIGIESKNGMFLELRSTAYSTPHMRFIIGFNF
jgi:hypothetical protein